MAYRSRYRCMHCVACRRVGVICALTHLSHLASACFACPPVTVTTTQMTMVVRLARAANRSGASKRQAMLPPSWHALLRMFVCLRGALAAMQDGMLRDALKKFGRDNWKRVADVFGDGRTDVQCQMRWQKVLNPTAVKGPWTKEVRACLARRRILFTKYMAVGC